MRLLPIFLKENLGSVSCADRIILNTRRKSKKGVISFFMPIQPKKDWILLSVITKIGQVTKKSKILTFPSLRKRFPAILRCG